MGISNPAATKTTWRPWTWIKSKPTTWAACGAQRDPPYPSVPSHGTFRPKPTLDGLVWGCFGSGKNQGFFLWLCPNSSSSALQCDFTCDYLQEVFGSGHDFAHKLPWTCPSLKHKATTPLKATREPENHPLFQTRTFYIICTLLNLSTESPRPNCLDSILASLSCDGVCPFGDS